MKYIKTFEDNSNQYKIGDYVFIDKNKYGYKEHIIAKILSTKEINKSSDLYEFGFDENTASYSIRLVGELPFTHIVCEIGDKKTPMTNKQIIRKLTPDEIEQYQMVQNANKYNL